MGVSWSSVFPSRSHVKEVAEFRIKMLTSEPVLSKFSWSDFSFAEVMHRCNQQCQQQWLLAIRGSPRGRIGFPDEAMLTTCALMQKSHCRDFSSFWLQWTFASQAQSTPESAKLLNQGQHSNSFQTHLHNSFSLSFWMLGSVSTCKVLIYFFFYLDNLHAPALSTQH